jgi:hypothetical protein
MKYVPLIDLKKRLSYWTEQAAQGIVIQITRYNKPFVVIRQAQQSELRVGKNIGKHHFRSIGTDPTNGKWLKTLIADRNDE